MHEYHSQHLVVTTYYSYTSFAVCTLVSTLPGHFT